MQYTVELGQAVLTIVVRIAVFLAEDNSGQQSRIKERNEQKFIECL